MSPARPSHPSAQRSYLAWHGAQWRVQVAVPRRLRGIVGAAVLFHPLHTDSLALANRDKHRHIHALKERIKAAEGELRRRKAEPDALVSEALQWREAFKDEAEAGDGGPYAPHDVSTALEARYDELVRAEGTARADTLAAIATGRATPLVPLADRWLEGKAMKARQRLGYRLAAGKLEAWLMSAGHPPTIEAVTKPVASDYRASLIKAGMHPRTANKDLSVLSGLWRYAEGRGVVADGFNPWRGQTIAASAGPSAEKRPFKDEEIATLLSYLARPERTPQDRRGRTPIQALIHDAVQLLALSGMRLEEMARMKVGHLRDLEGPLPYIDLRGTKTKAARRQVPIHPDALPIILRRARGPDGASMKDPDAYVLHELTTPPPDSTMDRGQPITKEFGRIRKRLGVDEREDGARTSNIDLHSLRRWFVRSAATALEGGAKGYSHWTIAEVVGHAKEEMALSMTMGRYAGDGTMEARAACVRAVKLPASVSLPLPQAGAAQ